MTLSPFFNKRPDRIILTTTDPAIHRMAEAATKLDFIELLGGQWFVESINSQQHIAGYSAFEIVLTRVMHALVAEIQK